MKTGREGAIEAQEFVTGKTGKLGGVGEYIVGPNKELIPKPVMTDRAKLAEKLFIDAMASRPMDEPVSMDDYASFSIDAANIFFNALEGKTDEDG